MSGRDIDCCGEKCVNRFGTCISFFAAKDNDAATGVCAKADNPLGISLKAGCKGKELLFLGSEKNKNIILTYQLEQAQIDALYHMLKALNFCGKLASVKDLDQVFSVSHCMAFLNFTSLDEGREQAFLTKIQTQAQKNLPEQPGKRKMPLTYILHCKAASEKKRPNLFINGDVFGDKDKLRLILLQEIKGGKSDKRKNPYSFRLERLLLMYYNLLRNGWLKKDRTVSNRRFYQDMAIVKLLVPDVRYDGIQDKYITDYVRPNYPDKEESHRALSAAKLPVRSKRILLIYQHLLYEGWITKEVADTLDKPVSLRMFQRDLKVIDALVEDIDYDMDQQKYVLAERISRYHSRFRKRNEERWVW